MKNIKSAFTLAEVLIAVAIVGVVAALTIPNLNKNINEDKYIALMKATMGQLDVAVAKVVSEYGSLYNASQSCGDGSTASITCFGQVLASYLDTKKICSSDDKSCFSEESLKDLKGNVVDQDRENASFSCVYRFILSNGVSVCMRAVQDVITYKNYKGRIDIDVDGPNAGPNIRAVDNFDFIVSDDGVGYYTGEDAGTDYYNKYINRGIDRAFYFNYDSVAWAFLNGNMDYLRCADQLKWHSKKTCD